MTKACNYLAFDLGASGGRAMLGQFDGRRIQLSEVHRFPNGPIQLPDGLHWDILRLWTEILTGIGHAVREHGKDLASVGIDTWGVDFALLDRQGALIGNPHHYRDARTDGMFEEAFRRMPKEQIFELTGIQFLQLNSLYQLLSMVINRSPALEIAETFLGLPNLFNYWLSGRMVNEFTHATTTQCYDPRRRTWANPLLTAMGIPRHIFGEIVPPGTVLGPLLPAVAEEVGLSGRPQGSPLQVIAPACHDTGSAVAAVPAERPLQRVEDPRQGTEGHDFAWISSGTWSIAGAELTEPHIDARSLAYNFTNEGGAAGTFRFCKNIAGLWLVQECRRTWAGQGRSYSWDELTQMAAQATPFRCVVNTDDAEFLRPGDMAERIRAYCRRTGQAEPQTHGEFIRGALEGIALKYRAVLEGLEEIIGRRLEPVHIVGGGTQNRLLSQFAADALGRRVITGPAEATALGNVLVQAVALGHIGSLAEARQVVRNSCELLTFEPGDRAGWDEAYARLADLME
jgi:rhamnulokinase